MRTYQGSFKKTTKTSTLTAVAEPPKAKDAKKQSGKRYPKKQRGPVVFCADDQALAHVLFLIRFEARPQLKRGATEQARADAKREAMRLAIGETYGINATGDGVRIRETGSGKRAGHIIGLVAGRPEDLPDTYAWLTSEPVRRLILAALEKLNDAKDGVVVVTPDDVVGVHEYSNAGSRRRARLKVKQHIGTGKPLESVQVFDGKQAMQAVHVEQTPDGWCIRWAVSLAGTGRFHMPVGVAAHKDPHAVPVWLLLVRQTANGHRQISMDTLLGVYNTRQDNAQKCRRALVRLLHDLTAHGLHIEAIAHHATRIQHRKSDGADYIEARAPKGHYLHYSIE